MPMPPRVCLVVAPISDSISDWYGLACVFWLCQPVQQTGILWSMRILRRSPGFTAAAVLTLAAGIAVVVEMFAVYWSVVLGPIRLPDPGAVVSIARVQKDPTVPTTLSWPRVQAMRAGADAFEAMGAFSNETVTLGEAGAPPR